MKLIDLLASIQLDQAQKWVFDSVQNVFEYVETNCYYDKITETQALKLITVYKDWINFKEGNPGPSSFEDMSIHLYKKLQEEMEEIKDRRWWR